MNDNDKTLLNLNSKPKPNNLVLQPERAAAVVGWIVVDKIAKQ